MKAIDLLAVAVAVLVFLFGAGHFAAHQSIWVDETTQLLGLALPRGELLSWLMGDSDIVLGVPPDRMPPLSYLLGQLWASVFGLSEISMRWLGISAVASASPALFLTGRIAGGRAGSVFVPAALLLSPSTMIIACEIRAYPLFLAFSAWATWSFARLLFLEDLRYQRRDLALLAAFLLCAAYTHFFGLIVAGLMFFTLLVDRLLAGRGVASVVFIWCVAALLMIGVMPFVLYAFSISGSSVIEETISGGSIYPVLTAVARLAFRLYMSPVLLALPTVLGLTAVSVMILLVLVFRGGRRRVVRQKSICDGARQLLFFLPVPLGIASLSILALFGSGFNALSPNYNIWMVPLAIAMLAPASSMARGSRLAGSVATIAMVIVVGANIAGAAVLTRQPTLFTHGPSEWLAAQISEPRQTLIIYESEDPWGQVYFPLFYISNGEITQWIEERSGRVEHLTPTGAVLIENPMSQRTSFVQVFRVRLKNTDSVTLARIIQGRLSCAGALRALSVDGKMYCSLVSATVELE